MGLARKFLRQDSDFRFFVEVYPTRGGPSRRLYLVTKDRPGAERIGELIRHPWQQGRADDVELRVDCARDIGDDPVKWASYLYECRHEDDPTETLQTDEGLRFNLLPLEN